MNDRPFFGRFDIICAIVAVALLPMFFIGGCASQQVVDQPTTPTSAPTMDSYETDMTDDEAARTLEITIAFAGDDVSVACVVDGESADCVPVRHARVSIIDAAATGIQEALRQAELEALCPRSPTSATSGDRDTSICEP